jgi:Anaphase-promoting complex, cyclosome, subunit 3
MADDILFDTIEAYIKGDLSPSEKQAFEIEIANNNDLATAVAMHRLEHEGMEHILETDLRQKMTSWETDSPPPTKRDDDRPFKRRFSKWTVVAGVGLVALFVGYIYTKMSNLTMRMPPSQPNTEPLQYDSTGRILNPNPIDTSKPPVVDNEKTPSVKMPEKPVFKENTKDLDKKEVNITQNNAPQIKEVDYETLAETAYQEPSLTTLRGSNPSDALSEASDAFSEKKYQKAIDALKNVPTADAQYAKSRVITAHAYFKLKQYEKAIPAFKELIKIGKPYSEDAQWYLILCYLTNHSNNKSAIDTNLKSILSDSLHLHFDDAQTLKKKLTQR